MWNVECCNCNFSLEAVFLTCALCAVPFCQFLKWVSNPQIPLIIQEEFFILCSRQVVKRVKSIDTKNATAETLKGNTPKSETSTYSENQSDSLKINAENNFWFQANGM